MNLHKLFSFSIGLILVLPASSYAFQPATKPLFLSQSVKHNLMFVVDDSGSMDFEIVPVLNEGPDDGYLFYNDRASPYEGKALYSDRDNIEAEKAYQYLRSSDYNIAFYDPAENYVPWTGYRYPEASVTSAKYDPNFNLTINLTDDFSNSDLKKASYFEVTTEGELQKTLDSVVTTEMQCAAPDPAIYNNWKDATDSYTFSGDATVLAPDGRCLKPVELVDDSDEIKNFANWFTYYRRPHLAARGAIGQAVSGLERMKLGMFYLNDRNLRGMYDADTEMSNFLAMNYGSNAIGRFGSGGGFKGSGIPLRTALKKAGEIYDTDDSVIEYQCQRNYTLLFTDGFTSRRDSVDGIGDADGGDGLPFADNKSGTMADIARFYYKKQLRASSGFTAGKVRQPEGCDQVDGASPLDCETNLHMTTYTVGMGSTGAHYAGLGDYTDVKAAFDIPPDWDVLNLGNQDNNEIDDLYHAAVNGHGEFFQADSTTQLRASLVNAIDKIKAQQGGAAAATFNTGTLEEGAKVYAGGFNSGEWSGSLVAREVDPYTSQSANIVWRAENLLDTRDLSLDDRVIISSSPETNNQGETTYTGVAFRWTENRTSLTPAQQTELTAGATAALGRQRLAFIRGDRSNERNEAGDGLFRKRDSRLGDIVGSSPVFVGTPALSWPDSDIFGDAQYSQFRSDNRERDSLVYVGANDGMLHGFDSETGKEKLAFVPSTVFDTLKNFTDPDYQHEFSVDLTPVISDVYITPRSSNQESWRTVLIGGSGMGGSGLFALDVTDPITFSEANASNMVLWEFDDSRMGVITEPPVISMVEWGDGDYRWTAMFGNGYGTDTTGMFMLDIGGGKDSWVEDTNFRFIKLSNGVGGLSAIRLGDVYDETGGLTADRVGDTVYAGDLGGNLWVIDGLNGFNKTAPTVPLFKTPTGQPITTKPVLSRHTQDPVGRNIMVFFGTGKYLEVSDRNDNTVQAFYGVWDKGDVNLSRDQDNLVERELTYDSDEIGVLRNVLEKTGEKLDWETKFGWYFDFDTAAYSGERVVLAPQIRKGSLFFDTTIPTGGVCSPGGQSFLMSLTLEGLDPPRSIFDTNNDSVIDSTDKLAGGYLTEDSGSAGSSFIGNVRNTRTNDGREVTTEYDIGGSPGGEGRASWREVLN